MKTCNKCKQEKEIELFEITNQGTKSSTCKLCRNIRKAEIRKEKAIASGRKPRRTFYERSKDIESGKQWCPSCNTLLELGKFVKLHEGTAVYCLLCANNRSKLRTKEERAEYYSKRKTIVRNSILKSKFGINKEQYREILVRQRNKCAICGKVNQENSIDGKSFAVDHDHKTGKIRGLLCTRCNPGLGFFNDDTKLLRKAINYLKKAQKHVVSQNSQPIS